MNLITLVNNKPEISTYALTIKEFKAIWDLDNTKHKDIAVNQLAYVYFYCDVKSPYFEYEEKIRGEKINEALTVKIKETDIIIKAKERYNNLNKNISILLLEDAMTSVHKMRDYFKDIDLLKEDNNGKLKYNSKQYVDNLKSLPDILKSIKKLREEIDNEMQEGIRVRGGGMLNIEEIPNR